MHRSAIGDSVFSSQSNSLETPEIAIKAPTKVEKHLSRNSCDIGALLPVFVGYDRLTKQLLGLSVDLLKGLSRVVLWQTRF